MALAPQTILIIGGGSSGMSAAIELRKRGHAVDIVEIDPGWRSYGAGISLGGPTLRAFCTLGIIDALLQQGSGADGLDIWTPLGAVVATLLTPRIAGPNVPGGGAILRPVLARIPADATRASGASVRLGCSFTSIEQDGDGVWVSFTDGQRQRYDLVIGAYPRSRSASTRSQSARCTCSSPKTGRTTTTLTRPALSICFAACWRPSRHRRCGRCASRSMPTRRSSTARWRAC